jgi:hypothetical protein
MLHLKDYYSHCQKTTTALHLRDTNFHVERVDLYLFSVFRILKLWILRDNQSTIDILCNVTLSNNIQKANEKFELHYTEGTITTNLMGWFHSNEIKIESSFQEYNQKGMQ